MTLGIKAKPYRQVKKRRREEGRSEYVETGNLFKAINTGWIQGGKTLGCESRERDEEGTETSRLGQS